MVKIDERLGNEQHMPYAGGENSESGRYRKA